LLLARLLAKRVLAEVEAGNLLDDGDDLENRGENKK